MMADEKNTVKKTTEKKKKSRIIPVVLGIIILAGAVFGVREYIFYKDFTTTDDAQVDGDINPVVARVVGYVEKINFDDNQYVHEGDTLVILDDRDYQVRLEQARAGMNISNAQVGVSLANVITTDADVAPAEAEVTAANAVLWQADQDYHRYKNLLAGHAITQSQFDDVKTRKETAEANLMVAKKKVMALQEHVRSTQEQVSATRSNIASQQSNIDFAKLQLSYTIITAPVSGIVSRRNIQIGQLVQPGQSMFAIVNTSKTYVTANFKETQLTKIKIGQPVDISVDAYPGQKIKGSVESFSGATGAKFSLLPPDNATGNYVKVVQRLPVRIVFDSLTADQKNELRPGLSVLVTVDVRDKQ